VSRIAPMSRASDERILRWLRLRQRFSANRIARNDGVNSGAVILATQAVAQADAAESGEDVRAAYPWVRL
jgi:hypothetical protein